MKPEEVLITIMHAFSDYIHHPECYRLDDIELRKYTKAWLQGTGCPDLIFNNVMEWNVDLKIPGNEQ